MQSLEKLPMPINNARSGKFVARLAVLGCTIGGLSGCQSIAVNANNAAQIRVVDATQNSAIDFYLNNTGLVFNIGFQRASSYIAVNPGTYTVAGDATGTRQALVSSTATLAAGRTYTALIGNSLASMQEVVLADQVNAAPAGQISVRFLDQAMAAGAVDVYLVPTNGKLSTTAVLVSNINMNGNSGYLTVPAGSYTIAVVPTGTVPSATTVALNSGVQVGFNSGAVRTVVLTDQQITTTPGISALVLSDDGT